MANSLVVPIILWGQNPPTHKICSILLVPDYKTIVTGCKDGQLCIWDIINDSIIPRSMLFGHTSSVISITTIAEIKPSTKWKKQYLYSASDNCELCLWDLVDGRCLEQTTLPGSPTVIKGHHITFDNKEQECIICYGQFAEILIISASTLAVLLSLSSRIYPDWFSGACLFTPDETGSTCDILGTTVSGMIKVWRIPNSFTQEVIYEDESKQVNFSLTVCVTVSKFEPSLLLVVGMDTWQVCDVGDYSVLCKSVAESRQQWIGGDFIFNETVVVWDRQGRIFIYQLPFCSSDQESFRSSQLGKAKDCSPRLLKKIVLDNRQSFILPPAINCCNNDDLAIIVMGSSDGEVIVSKMNFPTLEQVDLPMTKSITELWENLGYKPLGIIDQLSSHHGKPAEVTSSIFILQYCLLCCGQEDGSIVVVQAAKACKSHLFVDDSGSRKSCLSHRTLRGHNERVTCLLYPHQDSPKRYGPEVLLSGSADFSVIIWDVLSGTLLYSFNVHGGEILQLIIPPDGCNQRVNHSICSVASDHSVSLLSIRDRKCVLLASRHTASITTIRWRPDDDFLIVCCADSTVFVWQMETGHLDRCEYGAVALEIISGCDENLKQFAMNQNSRTLTQALKSRSLTAFKAVAQQGLKSFIEGLDSDKKNETDDDQNASNAYRPMIISSLRASVVHDSDSHVIFINTEALIAKLLMEHSFKYKLKNNSSEMLNSLPQNSRKKVFNSLIQQVKHQFLDDNSDSVTSSPQAKSKTKNKKRPGKFVADTAIHVAQIIISSVHAWDLDSNLDNICLERLGLLKPRAPICFGLLSQAGHMSLLLPRAAKRGFQHHDHWMISSSLTTQHLMSIISIANTMMELPDASLKPHKFQVPVDTQSSLSDEHNHALFDSMEQSQVKQGWSLLATLHCVLLPEKMNSRKYKPPKLELLARRWQDRCLELREAAQALMLAELRQMGSEGRRMVIVSWSKHVPDYSEHSGNNVPYFEQLNSPESYLVADDVGDRSSIASNELVTSHVQHHTSTTKLSYETRRRHATAIVILGVIGAEFGQELEPRKQVTKRTYSEIPDGFGLSNYSLARHTCKALVHLLLQPVSTKLPAHIPIRRAAIDLLGRGFTVWEPYMEVSAVLLGLLELCESYHKHIASIQSGLPLTPEADSCRSSHHSLSLIATARPLTFITTIAREVARHNAAAANPQHQALLATSVLVRGKPEVLRILELLADKMLSEVSNVLVEVVDIVLFCIDVSILGSSFGLLEAVPALAKFHTISYDAKSRRAAVAAGNGAIVLYDIRTCKHQLVPRNPSKISALCFSPDGKYLAVYSTSDNQLSFWITATSLFGMLQSQVKCIKTISPLKIQSPSQENFGYHKAHPPKLVWVNNRVVVLLNTDGSEARFHV